MTTTWSRQPLKLIYTIYFVAKLIFVIPLALLRYSLRSTRPFPEWSLKMSIVRVLARQLFVYFTATRSNGWDSVRSDHRKAGDRYALAEPGDASLYTGILTPGATKPAAVGGMWYPAPIMQGHSDLRYEKVVIHLTGGAFVLAFGTNENGVNICDALSQHFKATKTFLGQYRVAVDATSRFPAAIQDVVTFYQYVLSLGVPSENIFLSGDSAAGNLVLAFLRYLESGKPPILPQPGGALLWSPWVHVTPEAGEDYEKCRNAEKDVLIGPVLQWGVDEYLPEGGLTGDVVPYISPLHHPFETRVPVYIHAGGGEAFCDSITEFAKEMSAIEGNRIRLHTTDLLPHNLIIIYKVLGLGSQMEVALKDALHSFEGSD